MPLYGNGVDLWTPRLVFCKFFAPFLVRFKWPWCAVWLPPAFYSSIKSEAKNTSSSYFFLPAPLGGYYYLVLRGYFPLDLQDFALVGPIKLNTALFPGPTIFESSSSILITLAFDLCVRSADGMLGAKRLPEVD